MVFTVVKFNIMMFHLGDFFRWWGEGNKIRFLLFMTNVHIFFSLVGGSWREGWGRREGVGEREGTPILPLSPPLPLPIYSCCTCHIFFGVFNSIMSHTYTHPPRFPYLPPPPQISSESYIPKPVQPADASP